MKLKFFLIFLCLLFSLSRAAAQTGRFINTERGLSGSVVKQIYQDHDGIIWIATNSGINIYNGYQMITFQRDGEKENSLSSNLVNCIYQDRKGQMYVGTNVALQLYHNREFQTVSMREGQQASNSYYVNCVLQRKNGDVLIGTSGRGLWKMSGPKSAVRLGDLMANLFTVVSMAELPDGTLYLVSNDEGVFQLRGNRLRSFFAPDKRLTPQSICTDRLGNVYVGCLNGGVWMKRKNQEQFSLIASTANLYITSLCSLPTGHVLLGTDGSGVKDLDPLTGTLTTPPYYSNEVDLGTSKVSTLLSDRDGNIWLGLMQKGVFLQPTMRQGFHYMGSNLGPNNVIGDKCVMALAPTSDGGLWVSTDNGGLFLLDSHHRLVRKYACDGSSSMPHAILGIAEDVDHRLWVASFQEGCGWLDQQSGTYHRMPFTGANANAVFDVVADKKGNVWMGTMGDGVKQYNVKTKQLKEYRVGSDQAHSLYSNYIDQLYLSPDQRRLYVCTTGGLSCLDINSGSWTRVLGTNCLLKDMSAYDVLETPDHKVWIASPDGLYSYDLKSRKLTRYSTEQGLSSNIVMALLADAKGCIWMSTNNGVCSLNPKTGKVDKYYKGDGLQGNEFSEGVSAVVDATGLFCFGGMNGVTWFNPLQMDQVRHRLHIMLTDFQIGDVSVTANMKLSGYTVTRDPVVYSKRFDLGHQDNSFTITVTSLSYDNPERITYLYRVNGDKWQRMPLGKNTMTFAHMEPGTYHIQVKALDNLSESEVKEFTVRIHPAWYFSWWAEIIYALIVLYLIYIYMRSQKRKQQANLRLQEHIHAEQMSEAKLRFFINLSHDIRTPMTLILTPLISLIKEDKDPSRQSIYALMKRNAERILHLVNQMMDLRKIDKGQMALHCSKTDLVGFCRDVLELFQIQARNRQITLELDADADKIEAWVDRSQFDKVLMNLLSNAFKFTHTGGHILVKLSHDDEYVRLSVADDGETIPEDKLDRIFERFYQGSISLQGRQTGTGVGLDLVRSIIDLHHGTISARNTENPKGCSFDITLPMGNAHLKPEEILTEEQQKQIDRELNLAQQDEQYEAESQKAAEKGTASDDSSVSSNLPTVVVVDDEDDIRNYIAQTLSSDYHVLKCVNGKEALVTILKEMPDLVVSDVMMPEMDGFTLCANLKNNINTNHIPVILLTAKGRDEDKTEGMELGADAYISKPFSMDLLRSTIANLLRERALLRNKFSGQETVGNKVADVKLQNPDEKLLERVVSIINENLSNEEFSVDALSEAAGISRVHLYRKMEELTNQTPSEFIRNVRLKQAANLLNDPHQSISEVMYACGFSNRTSFSTMFKKFYGVSPREYQQEKRSKQ